MDDPYILLLDLRDLLTVGELMPFNVVDPQARLLLGIGRPLVSERQLDILVERDGQVERNEALAVRRARRGGSDTPAAVGASLFDAWDQRIWALDDLARRLRRNEATALQVEALVDDLALLVDRDIDIALFICMRRDDGRVHLYPLSHSLHACVLALLLARQLAWPPARIRSAARAALTMNVSKLELQAVLAAQVTPVTTVQRDQMRLHPLQSAQLLRAAGVQDADWLDAVENHHEVTGGHGYPAQALAVSDIAQLLQVADVIMAKVTPQARRPAMVPQRALRELFQAQSGSPLAVALIKTLGVHPPGSLVQLASGEVAVVVRRAVAGAGAKAATLSNERGLPVTDTKQRDTGQLPFTISAAVADTPLFPRVLPERVYGLVNT